MDGHRRSIAKTASWRLIATIVTAIVAWLVTGRVEVAAAIGAADTVVKLFAYYAHERLWERLQYGRGKPPPEYEI